MRPITAMHDTVPAITVADMQPDNFRRVTVTHAVYADALDMNARNKERYGHNVVMVTMRLADGGYVTVWPNGSIQVSDSNGNRSVNYHADTANVSLTVAPVQPE
jgi:hypothetical protein